jgi:coiled-coil domain-containing protein 115
MADEVIDELLVRYLQLLHEYHALREQLNALQVGLYQNIARANFAAERGMRFGQDYYDDRMQASRLIPISTSSEGIPSFTVRSEGDDDNQSAHSVGGQTQSSKDNLIEEPNQDDKANVNPPQKAPRDPLKWFGLITPSAIRQAHTQSVQAVEEVIPRLVSINTEMAQVEIEVRRARKKRAKAEAAAAAAKKSAHHTTSESGVTA